MKWFRFYHDAYRNPKVQDMRPELFKFWVNFLCVASESPERGVIQSEAHLRLALGLTKPLAKRWVSELEALSLLQRSDDGALRPHHWDELQPDSDDAAKRQRAHRARLSGDKPKDDEGQSSRDASRDMSRPETQTENETEIEKSVCVSPAPACAREGQDAADWQEAMAELQFSADARQIAGMLADSADVPSVRGLEAWQFIHAAHVMRGKPEKTTWNFFMGVARRANRREFDAWHAPPVPDQSPAQTVPIRPAPKSRGVMNDPVIRAWVESQGG